MYDEVSVGDRFGHYTVARMCRNAADAIEELSKRVDENSTLQNKGGKIK